MLQHIKTAAKLAVRSKGYDLVKGPTLHGFLASRNVDLVIDVGANKGDYGALLRRYGYKGRILSVEPTSGPFGQLVNRINGDPSWRPLNLALGAEPGRAEINISEDELFQLVPASEATWLTSFDPKMRHCRDREVLRSRR
jgi:FkbM family methyltransferase